jgi:hypothetical protein
VVAVTWLDDDIAVVVVVSGKWWETERVLTKVVVGGGVGDVALTRAARRSRNDGGTLVVPGSDVQRRCRRRQRGMGRTWDISVSSGKAVNRTRRITFQNTRPNMNKVARARY